MHRPWKALIVALVAAGLVGPAIAADYTWDDGDGADSNWNSPLNWTPDAVPAYTDVVHFTDTAVGTSIVNVDSAVAGMDFNNSAGQFDLQIGGTETLTVSNFLRVGNSTPATSSAKISGAGGTLRMAGDLEVSGDTNTLGSLLVDGCTLDSTDLGTLSVGTYGVGLLAVTNAPLSSGGTANSLTVGGDLTIPGTSPGILQLNPAATNIHVSGSLTWGGNTTIYGGHVDFGSSPQLQALTVEGDFQYERGEQFIYNNGSVTGLPAQIILSVGTAGSPSAMLIGQGRGPVSVISRLKRFETYVDSLQIAPNASSEGKGELNLYGAEVVMSGEADSFRVPGSFELGDKYPEFANVKLPGSVTNFHVENLYSGNHGNTDTIFFGTNSQCRMFRIDDDLGGPTAGDSYAVLNIYYLDGTGTPVKGFPTIGTDVRIGVSTAQRGTIDLPLSYRISHSGNIGPNIKTFEAYLDTLTLAANTSTRGTATGLIDARDAESVTLDIAGVAQLGNGTLNVSKMYIQNGTAQAGDLEIGIYNNAGGYNKANSALLWVSNLLFTATNSVVVGQTGDIEAYLHGASAGLDILTDSLTVETGLVGAANWYGVIDLNFLASPTNINNDYWGLRINGDQRALLGDFATNSPIRLSWDTNGLTASEASRFGIHYDGDNNWTLVGVQGLGAALRPKIFNEVATNVMTDSACMQGFLSSTGGFVTTVSLYWGDSDGVEPNSGNWAFTNSFAAGEWEEGDNPYFCTNNLTPAETYYYRWRAENTAGTHWPGDTTNFITGEVTIKATADAKEGWYNGEFTVYRPATCMDEDLTVSYTIDGAVVDPATYGVDNDYTLSPSGQVAIAAGQTSATIKVNVYFDAEPAEPTENVKLTLAAGPYAIGTADNATVQIENATLPNACRLDTEQLGNLEVGTYGFGVVDLSGAVIQNGTATNFLHVGGDLSLYTGVTGSKFGQLRLPFVITNIFVGGDFIMREDGCKLNFGSQPELETLTVEGDVLQGRDALMIYDGSTTGLPPDLTINIGTPASPSSLSLGLASGPTTRWAGMERFNAYLDSLEIGPDAYSNGDGELDLRGTEVVMDGVPNSFIVDSLDLGGGYSEYAVLRIPGSVTNFAVSNFVSSSEGTTDLVFDSNSQLRAVSVANLMTNDYRRQRLSIRYVDAGGTEQDGFPTSRPDLSIGISPSTRGSLFAPASRPPGGSGNVNIGPNIGRFEAYLDQLILGRLITTGGAHTSSLDARGGETVALDVAGIAQIGYGTYTYGYLYLEDGVATVGDLELGRYTNNTVHIKPNLGLLWLSNVVFTVTNSAEIGITGDVETYLYGQSAGIDVRTGSFNVETDTVYSTGWYGTLDLKFLADPASQSDFPFWGLRVKGDKLDDISELTNPPVRLQWDTGGLSPASLERFGIHYSAAGDFTYVGVSPPTGTIIMLR